MQKVKTFFLLMSALVLGGCIGYQPDQRVVGVFRASSGEAVDIRSDGLIVYIANKKEELVGLVTIDRDDPLSIRVIAPDTSPLVGTTISFSSDRQSIRVEWQDWKRAGAARPREFKKETPL